MNPEYTPFNKEVPIEFYKIYQSLADQQSRFDITLNQQEETTTELLKLKESLESDKEVFEEEKRVFEAEVIKERKASALRQSWWEDITTEYKDAVSQLKEEELNSSHLLDKCVDLSTRLEAYESKDPSIKRGRGWESK